MIMRKGQTAMEYLMTYGWAILIIMVVLAVLFYLGVLNPSSVTPSQCVFPAGFTCVTNQLKTSGKLYLVIGQGTGKTIMITGITCTQNTSMDFPTSGVISFGGNNNVNVSSGSQVTLGNPTFNGFVNQTNCTMANGSIMTGTVGGVYNGKIYINYTELDSGLVRVVTGTYTAKYEP